MSEEALNPEVAAEAVTETPVVETSAPVVEEKAAPVGEDVVVPKEFAAIVDAVEKMTVLQLNDLVKLLEKKWGVSAAAVAVAGPAAAAVEEKTDFTVVLTSDGGAKIAVMKVVKEALGLGLKEAKDMVEAIPATVKEGMKKEDAENLKKQIEEAGGKVELK